jgi:hypothetical protein
MISLPQKGKIQNMGNNICRLILARDVDSAAAAAFAHAIRHCVKRPTSLYLRDLRGKSVRKGHLVAARDAGVRILDASQSLPADTLETAATATFGLGRFIVRIADDEDTDITLPNLAALEALYPGLDLNWLLEPEENPIPWDSEPFHIFPGNPESWGLKVPLVAAFLAPAMPGLPRPCPMCRFTYSTKGDRGQCPSCGFVAMPFRSLIEAKTIQKAHLDAWAFGNCTRCRKPREFTQLVEQCFHCGQILEGDPGRYTLNLADNRPEIIALLKSL